ncbi:solute carrier family 22 member 4-like [Saccostrea echinata]|uniref:solute carrier family 22 member 4-like n=1 Tax=Saccostrea echinata TaxID=191078 RepID=UPI002A7F5816|nr:solute carrier family 22 member 4-like [Saccostrea echinata]
MKNDASAAIFEEILSQIHPFGYFQKRLFFVTSLVQTLVTTVILYTDFVYMNVKNSKCVYLQQYDNGTNISTVTDATKSSCDGEWFNQWKVPMWMNEETSPATFSYIWLCQGCGIIIGAVISGFLSDLIGRKLVLFVNLMLMSLSQGAVCILEDWILFMCMRGLVGVFAGGVIVPSCVQMIEHVGQNWRELCVCICAWAVGIPVLILEGLITRHWRWLGIVTSSTSLLSIGTYFIYPESFRWYTCRENFSKAEASIREMISVNATSLPDFTQLYDRAKLAVLNAMYKRPRTFFDLLHTRERMKTTIVLVFVWLFSCAVYRCLYERMAGRMSDNVYLDTFLVYLLDLTLVYTTMVITRCIGRRWCLFLYSVSSGFTLCCILVTHIIKTMNTNVDMTLGITIFGKLGVTSTVILISLVTLEVYPTSIRCMGFAVGLSSGIVGLCLGRFLYIEFFHKVHFSYPYICYGVVMGLVGCACLLFPETSSKPLPDLVRSRHRMISMKEVTRLSSAWEAH